MLKLIKTMSFGQVFAHLTFSALFIYDIIGNNNDFGWENAGLYAACTFGGEGILALAKLKYGAANGMGSGKLEADGNSVSGDFDNGVDNAPLSRQGNRTGKRKRRSF